MRSFQITCQFKKGDSMKYKIVMEIEVADPSWDVADEATLEMFLRESVENTEAGVHIASLSITQET